MPTFLLPLLAALLPLGAPPRQAPADTSRVFVGVMNQRYAWGTAALRNGRVLRAFLPATTTGLDAVVPYYQSVATDGPARKPKLLAVDEVLWMRVQGQYSELIKPDPHETGRLAARRATGELELFVVQYVRPVVVNLMGSTPVLSAPASASQGPASTTWYLRRPPAPAVLIEPERFATQMAAFLAKSPELARRVAAHEPGYGPAELEKLVQQYNQRAH